MRGRDHRRPRSWRRGRSFGDDDALVIDRHRHGLDLHLRQQFARGRIAGVFDPDAIAGLEKRAHDQFQRVPVARGHEDLGRRAGDAARHMQVGRDLGAQRRQAADRRMDHVGRLHRPHATCAQARPDLAREHVQRRQPHLERQDRIGPETGCARGVGDQRNRTRHGHCRLQAGGHDRAGLAACLDVALCRQQGIGRLDRAPGQAQLLHQRARGRDAIPGLEHPAGDRVAEPAVDLAVVRLRLRRIQRRDGAGLCCGHDVVDFPAGRWSDHDSRPGKSWISRNIRTWIFNTVHVRPRMNPLQRRIGAWR